METRRQRGIAQRATWMSAIHSSTSSLYRSFQISHCGTDDVLDCRMQFNDQRSSPAAASVRGHAVWLRVAHSRCQSPCMVLNSTYKHRQPSSIIRHANWFCSACPCKFHSNSKHSSLPIISTSALWHLNPSVIWPLDFACVSHVTVIFIVDIHHLIHLCQFIIIYCIINVTVEQPVDQYDVSF